MSPCNKGDEQKTALGMSPIAAGKKLFRPAKGKATRQIGIPKPKVHIVCMCASLVKRLVHETLLF